MKIRGEQDLRVPFAVKVYVDEKRLGHKESCKAYNHSPDGFQWGYGGSGPAQLALAILLLRTDKKTAIRYHQEFKSVFIVLLPKDEDFEVEIDVEEWIKEHGGKIQYSEPVFTREDEIADGGNGTCTYPQKCQRAKERFCDCSCNGVNHGLQQALFA